MYVANLTSIQTCFTDFLLWADNITLIAHSHYAIIYIINFNCNLIKQYPSVCKDSEAFEIVTCLLQFIRFCYFAISKILGTICILMRTPLNFTFSIVLDKQSGNIVDIIITVKMLCQMFLKNSVLRELAALIKNIQIFYIYSV